MSDGDQTGHDRPQIRKPGTWSHQQNIKSQRFVPFGTHQVNLGPHQPAQSHSVIIGIPISRLPHAS